MTITDNSNNFAPRQQWHKLCDYGDHPHRRGLQRLTYAAAQKIVHRHRSLYGCLKRYFSGIPVFIGHPDDAQFRGTPGHTDTRAYAWIHQLEAREDGLWVLPKWGPEGRRLLENAHYKHFSARWKLLPHSDGSFEPVELVSVGLTNNPNIWAPAIANEAEPAKAPTPPEIENVAMKKLSSQTLFKDSPSTYHHRGLSTVACSLGLSPQADADEVSEAIRRLQKDSKLAAENLALINAQLDLALERGQIAISEREAWLQKMQGDSAVANELLSLPRHRQIEARKPFYSDTFVFANSARHAPRDSFIHAVQQRMQSTGEDFSTAWSNTKEERRDIFAQLG